MSVYEKPTIADVEVTYDFPAYLERPRATVKQNHADLEAPQFTEAELKIHPSTPIARGHLLVAGETIDGQVTEDGRTLVARAYGSRKRRCSRSASSRPGGIPTPSPASTGSRRWPTPPPAVQLVEPARETRVAAGE